MTKKRVLFLCTGNSCRSQMAETWTRELKGTEFEAFSAGVEPKGLDPRAVAAMAEAGINISGNSSKDVSTLKDMEFDYVITLCDHASEACPFFPAKTRVMHRGFDDPPKLAADAVNEEVAMNHYRRVRDEIRAFAVRLDQEVKQA